MMQARAILSATLARPFATLMGSLALLCPVHAAYAVNQLPSGSNESSSAKVTTVAKKHDRKFSADTLYALLAAELAGSRQQYDVSLHFYTQEARKTRDPQVAARAALIARYLEAKESYLEMSSLWVEAAPTDVEALNNATLAHIQSNKLQDAFDFAKRAYALGGEPQFQLIAASANNLNKTQRDHLLQLFKTFLPRYTRDEQVLVGIGLLLQQQHAFDEAMSFAQKALEVDPRNIPAALLKANLLHSMNRDKEAISKMGELLSYYPDNLDLRNQYAHILTHYDTALAQQQFAIIAQQQPKNGEAILSLGIIAMQRKDYKAATKAFEKLLDFDQYASPAHYYLGRLAETQQNTQEAIFNYLQVERGTDFIPATTSLLDLFIAKGDLVSAQDHMNRLRLRYTDQTETLYLLHSQALTKYNKIEEAEKVLNEAVENHPNSTQLLYARAMFYVKRNQNGNVERDLRQLLHIDPENTMALNALGYLLADSSHRFREAEELLNKARARNPNDPNILDSTGWLQFRIGNYTEALRHLRQAYASSQDPGISAHLGEVLWVTGAQEDARQVWQEGLKQAPNDPTITATMKRLKAE